MRSAEKLNHAPLASEAIRRILELSSAATLHYLFPHWCRLPFSRLHLESLKRYDGLARESMAGKRRGQRLVLIAPRGYAKSALHSTLLPLLDVCFSREHFIVLISATQAQANGRLQAIRDEITRNKTLRILFPHVLTVAENNRRALVTGGVKIMAFGAGCELRGIGHATARPTKIVLDDVEESHRVYSTRYRDELSQWYHEVVEPLGEPTTHIEIVGTMLHDDSLLARLTRRADADVRRYRAIESWAVNEELWQKWRLIFTDLENPQRILDAQKFFTRHELTLLEGTAVLWPEKESYLQLMEQMVTMGRPAFFKEKQNIPPSAEGSIFCPETWHRFVLTKDGPLVAAPVGSDHIPISASAQHVSIFSQNDTVCDAAGHSGATPLPNDGGVTIETGHQLSYGRYHATPLSPGLAQLSVVGYLDPSLGRGDWAAIATVGKDPATGICYVLDVWVARVPPAAQVAKVFELHRRWRYQVFGYEAVGFQQILNETFAVENKKHCSEGKIMRQLDIRAVKSRKPKTLRIAGLEPLVASGWVRFAIGLPEELEAEARAFPSGRHDDALDALAGAVTLARSVGANQRIHTITVEPPRRQRPS